LEDLIKPEINVEPIHRPAEHGLAAL
jgi:hypothetical protein